MSYEETLKNLLQQLVDGKAEHDQKILQSNTKIEEMLDALKAPAVDANQVRKDQVLKITQNRNIL